MVREISLLTLLALASWAPGCLSTPTVMSTTQTANPDYSVDLLFTHEGCSVYRFEDRGHGVYYVDCGHSATTSQTLGCGRGCLRQETVQTTAGDEAPRTPTTTP